MKGFVSKKALMGLLIAVGLLAGAWWLGRVCFSDEKAVRAFFEQFPLVPSAILFVIFYVASSFIVFDVKDILKVVGALMFGVWGSTFLIWVAEMFNNTMLFHLARRLGRVWIEKKFGLQGKDIGWVEKLCGVWQIFILRIVPLLPYRVLDLAYGLTAVPFRRYLTVSAVASPLRIFWLQSVLAVVGGAIFEPQKVKEYYMGHPEAVQFGFIYLVASFIAAFILSKKLK